MALWPYKKSQAIEFADDARPFLSLRSIEARWRSGDCSPARHENSVLFMRSAGAPLTRLLIYYFDDVYLVPIRCEVHMRQRDMAVAIVV